MKNIFKILLTTVFITLIFPVASYAGYIKDTNQNEYGKCIDLQEAYKEVNNTSEAYTGESASVEASRKANILSALTSVFSIIVGDQFYCINDYEAYNETDGFENTGLLGFLEQGTNDMFASFPTVNVKDHLAETFVPGYESNNSTMAADAYCTADELANEGAYACCYRKCNYADDNSCFQNCFNQGTDTASGSTSSSDDEEISSGSIGETVDNVTKGILPTENDYKLTGKTIAKQRGAEYLMGLGIDKIWQKTRNIAYMAYVVVVIVIGFMIMFRNKIGGQTMVTVGNSIPQLVLGLFLVTFSFAIVGLFLDFGRVGIGVVHSFFDDKSHQELQITDYWGMADQATKAVNTSSSNNGIQSIDDDFKSNINSVNDGIKNALEGKWSILGISIGSLVAKLTTGMINMIMLPVVGVLSAASLITGKSAGLEGQIVKVVTSGGVSVLLHTLSEAVEDVGFPMVGSIFQFLFEAMNIPVMVFFIKNLLILLIVLFATIRVYATLLITYIKIFANVILAPIQILIGSFPGNSYAITNWFKSVISNVLVFVGIYLVINLAGYLGESLESGNVTANLDFYGTAGFEWPTWFISLNGVLVIAGYMFAASMPQIVSGFMKLGPSKEMGMAFGSVKEGFSKIPLIGGMFGR